MRKIPPIPSENLNDLHDIMTFMTHLFFAPKSAGIPNFFVSLQTK